MKIFRSRSGSQRRLPAQFPLTQTEQFERRLCLGGLNSPATGLADPDLHSGLAPADVYSVSSDAELDSWSDDDETRLPDDGPPETESSSTSQALAANLAEDPTIAVSPLDDGTFAPAVVTSLDDEPARKTARDAGDDWTHSSATGDESATGPTPTTATLATGAIAATAQAAEDITPAPASNDAIAGNGAAGHGISLSSDALAALGLHFDGSGNAVGYADSEHIGTLPPWWLGEDEPVVVKYDFRDIDGAQNRITDDQKARIVDALNAWSDATGGLLIFVQDTEAHSAHIVNFGTGDLSPLGYASGEGGVLGLSGGRVTRSAEGALNVEGLAWMDYAENWDTIIGNGDPAGTFDYFTVAAHEAGHAIGYGDAAVRTHQNIMTGIYDRERGLESIRYGVEHTGLYRGIEDGPAGEAFEVHAITTAAAQLTAAEVEQLLRRAAAASASEDGIFAVVDRNGRILGVRVEAGALAAIPDMATLVFAIDGAVAKARTAAFFSSGDINSNPSGSLGPLTSRVIQALSASTITQREVEANPNSADPTIRGPGYVAPIGLGGHFPDNIAATPPVDLFAIEHTNRDSNIHPGADGIKGTADDIDLRTVLDGMGRERGRFNIDPAFVPMGQELFAPESYGHVQNSGLLPNAQSRGIATLPGGIPLFRDANLDGIGDTLVGGIGVFFPGPDGFATFEQGFIPGVGQTQEQRLNAPRVLEAEYIAFAAAGGSISAAIQGIDGAKIGTINGVAPIPGLDMPFGRIDLVGITLPLIGPIAGRIGLEKILALGTTYGLGDPTSGADQPLAGGVGGLYRAGEIVPEGWLVMPHASAVDGISAADVEQIIRNGINAANAVRAAIRVPIGNRAKMIFAVTDTTGEILGLYRMPDATVFSIDVAVAKARNVAYYADAADLQPIDQVAQAGIAFTNRTFRFLAEPRFPSGVDNSPPPPFSILNDPGINPRTAENTGAPTPDTAFQTVLGYDSFNPMSNFRDPGDPTVVADAGVDPSRANQNGIVFFPGSTPLYLNGRLIGGFGVSGDGVDQDDVVTFIGAQGYLPNGTAIRADQIEIRGTRLPYIKFLRNPFG